MTPSDRDTWLLRIGELVERSAYRQALKACDQALVAHPDLAEAHDYRGLILSRMGRHPEALSAYDKALQLEPEFLAALLDKAELLVYHLQEDEEAIAVTDRVLRLGTQELDRAHAHHLKGIAYANMGRFEEAIANFDLAIELDPDYPDTHCERGVALFESYRFAEALKSLRAAVAIDPQYGRPHQFLAAVFEHLGEDERARDEQALAAKVDDEERELGISLPEDDFAAVLKEAVNVQPREVQRRLAGVSIEAQRLPDRRLLADGIVRPSAGAVLLEEAGDARLVVYQRNLERLVRNRVELVDEVAHAIAHELGHPESEGHPPH